MKMAIFQARTWTWLSRSFSTLSSHPLRVCVIGSGPAGFYTAEKIVVNQFSRVARHDRCSVFENVTLGSSVFISELRELYHVVVLAYGAESDRVLGIPGERICLVVNGTQIAKNLDLDLENTDTAFILGQGNVALDVACIFLQPATELAAIDIASHALAALEKSSIRKVYLVGRNGPVQAACTAKELREVLDIKDLCIHLQEADLHKTPKDEEEIKNYRIQRRVYELLSKAAAPQDLPIQDLVNVNSTLFSSGNQIGF